jgi:hypothetical protein
MEVCVDQTHYEMFILSAEISTELRHLVGIFRLVSEALPPALACLLLHCSRDSRKEPSIRSVIALVLRNSP